MKKKLLINLLIPLLFTYANPSFSESYVCSGIDNSLQTFTRKGDTFEKTFQLEGLEGYSIDYRIITENHRYLVAVNDEDVVGDTPNAEVVFIDKQKSKMSFNTLYPFGGNRYGNEMYGVGGDLETCSRVGS